MIPCRFKKSLKWRIFLEAETCIRFIFKNSSLMFCNLYCWHYSLLQEAIEVGKKRKREEMEEASRKREETKEVTVLTSKTQSSAQETKGVTAAPPKKRRWFDEEEALLEELSASEEDSWCHGIVYPHSLYSSFIFMCNCALHLFSSKTPCPRLFRFMRNDERKRILPLVRYLECAPYRPCSTIM